jgi:hypothetical protein
LATHSTLELKKKIFHNEIVNHTEGLKTLDDIIQITALVHFTLIANLEIKTRFKKEKPNIKNLLTWKLHANLRSND